MPKVVKDFRKSSIDHIYKASQKQRGKDLTGMIIVDYTIFKAILNACSEDILRKLLVELPLKPSSNDIVDVSNWCSLYYNVISKLDPSLKTQSEFATAVGLTQSDISSLLSARSNFYFGEDRIEKLHESFSDIILRRTKKAS